MATKTTTPAKTAAEKDPAKDPANAERVCPACGKLHGSSFVPAGEIGTLAGVNVEALEAAELYRVFRCGGAFHVRPHKEEGAA